MYLLIELMCLVSISVPMGNLLFGIKTNKKTVRLPKGFENGIISARPNPPPMPPKWQ